MGEYIERKALLNALKEERKNGNFVFTSKWIKEIMDGLPTADVVPKSEVDKIIAIFEVWLYKHYNGDITEWEFYKLFAELKKKYTEDKK